MAGIRKNKSVTGSPVKKDKTYLVVCVAVFCFVFLIISFFPMTGEIKDDKYIKKLEKRITALEDQLAATDLTSDRLRELSLQSSKMESFINNYNRLDATISLKTNLLAGRIDKMQSQIDGMGKAVVQKNSVIKKLKTERKKVVARKYHTVKKGETFYSISRLHGITLSKIRALNGFTEQTVIYPGQKILVK